MLLGSTPMPKCPSSKYLYIPSDFVYKIGRFWLSLSMYTNPNVSLKEGIAKFDVLS